MVIFLDDGGSCGQEQSNVSKIVCVLLQITTLIVHLLMIGTIASKGLYGPSLDYKAKLEWVKAYLLPVIFSAVIVKSP